MDTTIFFSHSETGHVLEYFHHIYGICLEIPEKRFIFVVPERFEELKRKVTWPDASNVFFDYISSTENKTYQGKSVFKLSYSLSKILCERIKKYQATKVLSLFWFPVVPFGVMMFPRGLKASAILYDVYLRERDELSVQARLRHYLNFWLFAKSRRVERAFVLNDDSMASILNNKYNTTHFCTLPDPFNPIPDDGLINLRDEYGIGEDVTLFAHFGGLAKRKGTLRILDAAELLSVQEKKNCCFVFAGRVDSEIKVDFYNKVKQFSKNSRVIVKDEFCSYSFLASLCKCCNCILIPYEFANRSSGLLGYASHYCKPVIAPNYGLIGHLVNEYKLGITGNVMDTKELADLMRCAINYELNYSSRNYCFINSVDNFCNVIRRTI